MKIFHVVGHILLVHIIPLEYLCYITNSFNQLALSEHHIYQPLLTPQFTTLDKTLILTPLLPLPATVQIV